MITTMAVIVGLVISFGANAQVRVNINIGNQPAWGPTGYNYVQYYYLPEINAYYDVNARRFMYLDRRGRWITARSLPRYYESVDLYRTYKVVIDRRYAPYRDNRNDIRKYGNYRNSNRQIALDNVKDYRRYEKRHHSRHDRWNRDRDDNRYESDYGQRDREYERRDER